MPAHSWFVFTSLNNRAYPKRATSGSTYTNANVEGTFLYTSANPLGGKFPYPKQVDENASKIQHLATSSQKLNIKLVLYKLCSRSPLCSSLIQKMEGDNTTMVLNMSLFGETMCPL